MTFKRLESVWDYPRPPRLELATRHLQVMFAGVLIAETRSACRVLETSHPPTYYFPPEAVRREYLVASPLQSVCEFKGRAAYFSLDVNGRRSANAAWCYADPPPPFAALRGWIAFYPGRVDACLVDGEPVKAQPGDFYGGWITSDIQGPFKGGPGSQGW